MLNIQTARKAFISNAPNSRVSAQQIGPKIAGKAANLPNSETGDLRVQRMPTTERDKGLEFTDKTIDLLDQEGKNGHIQHMSPTKMQERIRTSTVTVTRLGLHKANLARSIQHKKDDFDLKWFHDIIGASGWRRDNIAPIWHTIRRIYEL